MSAYLCGENHLSLLANVASDDSTEQDRIFAVLLRENLRSLQTRYPNDIDEYKAEAAPFKRHTESTRKLIKASFGRYAKLKQSDEIVSRRAVAIQIGIVSSVAIATQIVKCCDCYDYQACETADYKTTEAAKLVDKIREDSVFVGGRTKGELYDQMTWGLY